jgi:integrase
VQFGPPKSDAGRRTIAIPAELVAELDHHLASYSAPGPDGLVFVGAKGAPLTRGNWHIKWSDATCKVDLPPRFRFHDLRHTSNTLAAAAGASTRELMHRMGHASPAAALRYQHATAERDAEIAAVLGRALRRPTTKHQAVQ